MNLTITLTTKTEAGLKRLAARDGREPEEYAGDLLAERINEELALAGNAEEDPEALGRAVAKMKARTPEQIAAEREEIFLLARPPRAVPPEIDVFDCIYGKLHTEETDEEVSAALEKLS